MPDRPVLRGTSARIHIGRSSQRLALAPTHWSLSRLPGLQSLPVFCAFFPPSERERLHGCRAGHCRLYIRLAAVSALVQPTRLPCASSLLARVRATSNVACARASAPATEPGVGWRSSWASIVWRAVGP